MPLSGNSSKVPLRVNCKPVCRWSRHRRPILCQVERIVDPTCNKPASRGIHKHAADVLTRRSAILAATRLAVSLLIPLGAAAGADADAQLPPGAAEIEAFFYQQVHLLQHSLKGFDARLTWYTPKAVLPAGAIGDPAKDFKSSGKFGDGHCGTFTPGNDTPYATCPEPGCAAADETAKLCCRHFAYLVPYSPTARAERNKISTVIVAPRLAKLKVDVWQAMLMHELGHCIDVHVYGRRYRLQNHPLADPVQSMLEEIDRAETNPEARADFFGNAMLGDAVGRKLCYDPRTLLQTLVERSADCGGTGASDDARPLDHYVHDLLAGFAPK